MTTLRRTRTAAGRAGPAEGREDARALLSPRQLAAAREAVGRVRREVPAVLEWALLFGSRARRQARPDSDVDVLLVFRDLPPDREPHAGHAEAIFEEVAARTGVPVTVWSVSLPDLDRGERTPMLVDALHDGVPLWCRACDPPRVPFTPDDALRCVDALFLRLREGAEELERHRRAGAAGPAARRVRDDLVRLCTAALLLAGETRPRLAGAVARFRARFVRSGRAPAVDPRLLEWAIRSFGPLGKDDEAPVPPPPGGTARAAAQVEALRRWVGGGWEALRGRTAGRGIGAGEPVTGMGAIYGGARELRPPGPSGAGARPRSDGS